MVIMNQKQKAELQPRVHQNRMEFDKLKRTFHKLKDNYTSQQEREALLGAHIEKKEENNSKALLKYKEITQKQNQALENAIRIGYETGEVAINIEQNLGDQNERLKKSRVKVKSIQGELRESDSILIRMLRREKINRLALSGVCVLLIIALMIVLYFKLRY